MPHAPERRIFLVDNGSGRPAATLHLRRIAAAVSERSDLLVEPVSMQHADKVDAAALGGEPARTFGPAATAAAREGAREIVVIPFFFGPTRALTSYLAEQVAALRAEHPGVAVTVARPLADPDGPLDLRLARALRDGVEAVTAAGTVPAVALVDHGSPIPEVTAVRNMLAGQLGALLQGKADRVAAASMERRGGDAYRFNEPLLEHLLGRPGFDRNVVVAMLFLSPGRHAGPDGDVARICRDAEARHPGLITRLTPLVADQPAVVDILADRVREAVAGEALFAVHAG